MVLTNFNLETNHHNHIPKYYIHHSECDRNCSGNGSSQATWFHGSQLLRNRSVTQIAARNHGLYHGSEVEWCPMREYSRNIRYIHFLWDDDNTRTLEWNTYHTRNIRHLLQPSTPHPRLLISMKSNSLGFFLTDNHHVNIVGNQILLSVLHKNNVQCAAGNTTQVS